MALETETLYPESEISDNNKLCYCCSIHGCVKDIYTEYYDTGKCEVYSEIIKSTFDINIAYDKQKYLPKTLCKQYIIICEYCIKQLRNAYNFKITLMKNHEDFLRRLTKWQKTGFKDETKNERIKSESSHSDDIINCFNHDDQPKGENQLEISIKNELNVECMIQSNHQIGIIDTKIEPDERKRKKIAKIFLVKSENKLNSSRKINPETKVNRRIQSNLDGKRTKNTGATGTILRDNSLKLITNSSLWVFQWKQHGEYTCYLCKESYKDIQLLKTHTKTHTIQEIEEKISNSNNGRVKVEITDLNCKICDKKLENLTDLQKHLKIHNIFINDHLLVPFKLDNEFSCQICTKNFKNFRLLKSHMLKHFQSFICEICGSEFYKKEYLSDHIQNRHKTKTNDQKKFKCRLCDAKFSTYPRKLEHMVQNHGLEKPEFSCKLCPKVYIIKGLLNRHMKLSHLNELKEKNYECDVCFKRFYRTHDVKRHKETHSDGLNYSCRVCNHSFKLKTSLDRHMRRIHK